MKVIWLTPSKLDLANIINYIADDNPLAALELDEAIISATNGLADFPHMGRHGRIKGTRELIVYNNYIIVYQVLKKEVYILTILHASRQWPPLLERN